MQPLGGPLGHRKFGRLSEGVRGGFWGAFGAFLEVSGDPQVRLEEPETVEILVRNEHVHFLVIFDGKLVSYILEKKS